MNKGLGKRSPWFASRFPWFRTKIGGHLQFTSVSRVPWFGQQLQHGMGQRSPCVLSRYRGERCLMPRQSLVKSRHVATETFCKIINSIHTAINDISHGIFVPCYGIHYISHGSFVSCYGIFYTENGEQ